MGEAWELPKKQRFFGNLGILGRKFFFSIFIVIEEL
jgi:hypothetical protein